MSFTFEKLGAICSINPRLPKDSNESQEVSFLSMSSVSEGGKILDQETRVLSETKKGFTYFEREDILLAKITPCFENGKAVLTSNLKNLIGYGSTEFHVLRPIPEIANGKYLFYLVWNDSFRHHGQHAMKGAAGQKRISTDFLKNFKIPLPPLAEQQKIAAILDAADQLRQKDQQLIEKYTALSQSLFLEMFGDPVNNPKGWNQTTLGEVCNKIYGGGTPSKAITEYYIGNIPWVTPKDMKSEYIGDSIDHINNEAIDNSSAKLIPPQAVLMVIRSGILKHTLPVAINTCDVTVNQDMKAFIPDYTKTNSWYLLHYFKGVENYLLGKVRAVTADNIEFRQIKGLFFPLPPLSLQNQFAERIQAIEAQKQQALASLQKSEDLFNSLLQRAFKGELTA